MYDTSAKPQWTKRKSDQNVWIQECEFYSGQWFGQSARTWMLCSHAQILWPIVFIHGNIKSFSKNVWIQCPQVGLALTPIVSRKYVSRPAVKSCWIFKQRFLSARHFLYWAIRFIEGPWQLLNWFLHGTGSESGLCRAFSCRPKQAHTVLRDRFKHQYIISVGYTVYEMDTAIEVSIIGINVRRARSPGPADTQATSHKGSYGMETFAQLSSTSNEFRYDLAVGNASHPLSWYCLWLFASAKARRLGYHYCYLSSNSVYSHPQPEAAKWVTNGTWGEVSPSSQGRCTTTCSFTGHPVMFKGWGPEEPCSVL